MKITANKVVGLALGEIGYLEKKTNDQLDSKTANAGKNNYTKYARDMDEIPDFFNGIKNGFFWCAVFICWCFMKAFGAEKAMELLCLPKHSAGASCTYLASRFKAAGRLDRKPAVGSLALFSSDGGKKFYHIGLVYKVDATYVYTVEGNTASTSGVVANGGGVFPKMYRKNSSGIWYAHPDYDESPEPAEDKIKVHTEIWMDKDEKGRILDIALKVDHGSIWYQVHTLNGRWLPKVTGFDKKDYINGYAGNHVPIDAVRVYYETPDGEPYQQARYAVKTVKDSERWLPDQVDNYTHDEMDGYAGNLGEAITDFRWRVDDE